MLFHSRVMPGAVGLVEVSAGVGVLPKAAETVARLFDPAVTREFNQVIEEASA